MFGTIRFFLASSVVMMHLTSATKIAGYQAVFSFYILSGYLMTRVLNQNYGFTAGGRVYFLVNRGLRIFPPYWMVIIISIIVILASPELAKNMNKGLYIPSNPNEWLLNLFIVFHSPPGETPRLIPPVWTLHVELVYYFFMCFFLSKSKRRVHTWFGFSVVLTVGMFLYSTFFHHRLLDTMYFSTLAGSLPFSIGALIYFVTGENQTVRSDKKFMAYVLLFISFYGLSTLLHNAHPKLFWPLFYSNLLISAFVIYNLHFFIRAGSLYKKADQIIGDLSYPIYLLHWPIAVLITSVFFHQTNRSIFFFAVALSATIAVSLLINILVEKPISKMRDIVRRTG